MTPLLMIHVGAGALGIVSGTAALAVHKGEFAHRAFGTVFFISMLVMASTGAYLGLLMQHGALLVGGILTCYLVATAWLTVRRKAGTIGRIERFAPFVALAGAAVSLYFGLQALQAPSGQFQGVPAVAYFGSVSVAGLAALLDLKVIRNGGISGRPRIRRHLWRMCVALFEATGAFFLGQQKVMPAFMHGSPVLIVLAVAPLLMMVLWLVRVRFTKWYIEGTP